jgi:hypothetical protein
VVFLSEIGEMVVVGDHKGIDVRKADVEARVVVDFGGEVLEVAPDFIGIDEIGRVVETAEPFRVYLEEFFALLQLLNLPCLDNAYVFLVLYLSCQFPADFIHEILPKLLLGDAIVAHALNHHRKIDIKLLKILLPCVELLVVVEEKGGDFLGSQSDAIELVDIVEDGKVATDGADLAGSRPHRNRQLFLCLPCVFGGVRARIAKLGQPDAGVAVAVCVFIVEKGSHFLPAIFSLTRYVVNSGAIAALLIGKVAESVADVAPVSLQILTYALEAIFVVLRVLPLF